jgi:hypothetical protein
MKNDLKVSGPSEDYIRGSRIFQQADVSFSFFRICGLKISKYYVKNFHIFSAMKSLEHDYFI